MFWHLFISFGVKLSWPELVLGFSLSIIACTSVGFVGCKNRLLGNGSCWFNSEAVFSVRGIFLASDGPILVKYSLKPLAISLSVVND